jgi:hypothetical protein
MTYPRNTAEQALQAVAELWEKRSAADRGDDIACDTALLLSGINLLVSRDAEQALNAMAHALHLLMTKPRYRKMVGELDGR